MPFPFLVRGNIVTRLQLPGVPLGLLEETSYTEMSFQLEPGDTLILTSDGAMDALNAEGHFYDNYRITESIGRHSNKEVRGFLSSVYSELRQFIGEAELSDDITVLALRRKK